MNISCFLIITETEQFRVDLYTTFTQGIHVCLSMFLILLLSAGQRHCFALGSFRFQNPTILTENSSFISSVTRGKCWEGTSN